MAGRARARISSDGLTKVTKNREGGMDMVVTRDRRAGADLPGARGPSLLERYHNVRSASLQLATPLSVEDQCVQSMPDASPTKWHLAHTTWFFESFVLASLPGHEPFHPRYNFLFNSYYEAVGR